MCLLPSTCNPIFRWISKKAWIKNELKEYSDSMANENENILAVKSFFGNNPCNPIASFYYKDYLDHEDICPKITFQHSIAA